MYCKYCGAEISDDVKFCPVCGKSLAEEKEEKKEKEEFIEGADNNLIRFLLVFFLWFIGSIIINHTSLKPKGWRSRTLAIFFLTYITFGIYPLVAAICNLTFDPKRSSNIGYFKE